MTRYGLTLSSEEHPAPHLVQVAMAPQQPEINSISRAQDAGIDYIYLHQIGDPVDGFIEFCSGQLLPRLQWASA